MTETNHWTRPGRRRFLHGAALTGAGTVSWLVAACGGGGWGGGGGAGQSSGSAPAAPGSAAAPGEQPVSGGAIVGLQSRDASSLDPLASQVYTTPERIGLVYPRLIYYDRDEKAGFADTKIVPSYITDKMELSADGATITFHLKKGVKFSKTPPVNGRDVTSEDVKFSFNRYMTDPTSAFKARYADIDKIETPDAATVVFKLKAPSAYVLYAIGAEPSFITPPEVAKEQGDFKQVAIGAGPFLHEKTTQGEGSNFKKNPDFVHADKIYYDRFDIKVVTDKATRIAALRTAQADFDASGAGLFKSEWQPVTRGNPSVQSLERPPLGSMGVWFNMKNPKWKDPRARKAISKAINRQEIIDRLQESDGVFSGAVPAGFGKWALTDEQMRAHDAYKFDASAAKQLWSAAGSPATTMEFGIPPKQNRPDYVNIGELIAQQLKANLGIEVTFTTDEYNTYINKVYNNKFSDTAMGFMTLYDPLDNLLAQYYPGGARNGPGLEDAKLTALLDDVKGTTDEAARVKKMIDVQKYINDEVLSMAHLPQPRTYDVWNAKLRNWLPGARPPGIEWTLASWKAK